MTPEEREIVAETTAIAARHLENAAEGIRQFALPGITPGEQDAAREMRAVVVRYLMSLSAIYQRHADEVREG